MTNRSKSIAHKPRRMSGSDASRLYKRLKPYLRKVRPWDCYSPKRGQYEAGDHSAWPLLWWQGPGFRPLIFQWNPRGEGAHPTFKQFCLVYSLEVYEDEDS